MESTIAQQARFNMLHQQIRPWEAVNSLVLEAMDHVPREVFVPDAYRGVAFADVDIPIQGGRAMLSPKIVARLLHAANVHAGDNVLELGTCCGYVTACLSRMGGYVTSLEHDASLLSKASERLGALGVHNVSLVPVNDNYALPGGAFDVVVISGGSLAERDPVLEARLTLGGRMVAIIGTGPAKAAMLIERLGDDEWRAQVLFESDLPPLVSTTVPSSFVF